MHRFLRGHLRKAFKGWFGVLLLINAYACVLWIPFYSNYLSNCAQDESHPHRRLSLHVVASSACGTYSLLSVATFGTAIVPEQQRILAALSWDAQPEVGEVILVGERSLWAHVVTATPAGKIVLVTVDSPPAWTFARFMNLATRLARHECLVYVRPGIILQTGFYNAHFMGSQQLYVGSRPNSFALFKRTDWANVGGFNECVGDASLAVDYFAYAVSALNITKVIPSRATIPGAKLTTDARTFLRAHLDRFQRSLRCLLDASSASLGISEFACHQTSTHQVSCRAGERRHAPRAMSPDMREVFRFGIRIHSLVQDSILNQRGLDIGTLSTLYLMHTWARNKFVLVHSRFSLSERILGVAFVQAIATQRRLIPIVAWTPDGLVNCSIADIFANPPLSLQRFDAGMLAGLYVHPVALSAMTGRALAKNGALELRLPFGFANLLPSELTVPAAICLQNAHFTAGVATLATTVRDGMPPNWVSMLIQCKEHILTDMDSSHANEGSTVCHPSAFFEQAKKMQIDGIVLHTDTPIDAAVSPGSHITRYANLPETTTRKGSIAHAAHLLAMSQGTFIGSHQSPSSLLVEMLAMRSPGSSAPYPFPTLACVGSIHAVVQFPVLAPEFLLRQVEYFITLARLLKHPAVKKVHVLVAESQHTAELKFLQLYDPCGKLTVHCCHHDWVTYRTFMQFVSDHLIGKHALIMQSDIYLGEVSGFESTYLNVQAFQ